MIEKQNGQHGEIRRFLLATFPPAGANGRLTDQTPLLSGGIIDSIGIMSVILFLEQRFEVEIVDDDLDPANFDSIDQIVAFVERKRAG